MPTMRPNLRVVSAAKSVPSSQCRHVRTPPATAVGSDTTEPAARTFRQEVGGLSCAQPNQAGAKKPKITAVAAMSRTNGAVTWVHCWLDDVLLSFSHRLCSL